MALTITVDHLYQDLHVGPTTENAQRMQRYLDAAKPIILRYAPGAPDNVQDRAASMLVAYWWDADPQASEYAARANAFGNSGARATLAPWRRRVAGVARQGRATPAAPGPALIATFNPAAGNGNWQDTGVDLADLPPVFAVNWGAAAGNRRSGELVSVLRAALEAGGVAVAGQLVSHSVGVQFNAAISDATDGHLALDAAGNLLYGTGDANFSSDTFTVWRL